MDSRVQELIDRLELSPHPEGGYFREVFRSTRSVSPGDDRDQRAALTTIYFLLASGQRSRWHRVRSDEVWHFYEGEPLELLWIGESEDPRVERLVMGAVRGDDRRPVTTIQAGSWQAARPLGAYALMGCSVGPGFDFADFEMLEDRPDELGRLEGLLVLEGLERLL